MDRLPKICVATPIYNGAKYLERLVKSLSEYNDVVWLVRDDGSTDDTSKLIWDLIKGTKIKLYLWSGENYGLTYGRNFLCDKFVNESELQEFTHMIFIDADDYFNPGWRTTIEYWINKVDKMYPGEKTPYLCFKYWNDRSKQDECQIYSKLNTPYKAHPAVCQYPGGGWDLLHVIPREYLIEVKEFDGNYYHTRKDTKWTPDMHNFIAYTDYKASFVSDMVASLGECEENMSSTYYDNIVTRYAKGQLDAAIMFMDVYGSDSHELGFDPARIPWHRWRWYAKCLIRMVKNGTLVLSDKNEDKSYKSPEDVVDSKPVY